jgi:intracellular multiplication protein IcmB
MNFISDAVSRLVDAVARYESPGSNCSLNLPIGNSGVITSKNGSLVSVINIRGCRKYIGLAEHENNVKELNAKMMPMFKSKAYDFGFFFETDNDPDVVKSKLDEIYSPTKSAIRALNLNYDSILEEEKQVLADCSHVEHCWLVCWTNTRASSHIAKEDALSSESLKQFHSSDHQDFSGLNHAASRGSAHDAMVDSLMSTFNYLDYSVEKLTTNQIIKNIRKTIDPQKTNDKWEPIIVGDRRSMKLYIPDNVKNSIKHGIAGLMPPKIGNQVWPSEPVISKDNTEVLVVGSRAYKVIVLNIQPNGRVPFNKVLKEAARQKIPLRFSGVLKSAGSAMITAKMLVASITTILPLPSRALLVRDEMVKLKKYLVQNRLLETSVQMTFVTWQPKNSIELLEYKSDKLIQIINSWEQASAYFLKDNIFEGYCGSLPSYINASVAPVAVAPLDDVLFCMPITRPVMPSDKGGMCFRSEDGKLMPWQPFDYNVMRHHIYLVVGEPGFGKSALINNLQVSLLASSNAIPYIGMADVGTSSLGAIQLAQSLLPEGKKHFAKYHRLKNRMEESYNFLEQDYGLRLPLKEHLDEINNHLQLMMSDDRSDYLHPDLPGLISTVLRLAYRLLSDDDSKSSPILFKRYLQNDKHWPIVAKALHKLNFIPTQDHSWWEIFDLLHDNNYFHEATLVMRFVSPTLPYLSQVATRSEVREEYPGNADSGTKLVDFFARKIGELVEKYPIFSNYTQLDLGEARIIALDLEEVVPRSSDGDYALKKQGAIFFATGARILTSRFFWKEDRLNDIPNKYHSYHEPRIKSIRQTTNALQIDELQRFSGISQADNLCYRIANEGRKWEIGIILASQDTIEMPDRVIAFSTARIICGFEEKSIQNVKKSFKLNETEVALVVNEIRPPSKNGGWILMQLDTDEVKYSHFLNIRMGSQKLWGLSTKNKDAIVRTAIYKEFGDHRGRVILKKLYPGGSIGDEYDYRVQSLSETHDVGLMTLEQINENTDVIQSIIDSIIDKGKGIERIELGASV